MVSLSAMAGNSCSAIRSLIVFLTMFWSLKVRSLSTFFMKRGATVYALVFSTNLQTRIVFASSVTLPPTQHHSFFETYSLYSYAKIHHTTLNYAKLNKTSTTHYTKLHVLYLTTTHFIRLHRTKSTSPNYTTPHYTTLYHTTQHYSRLHLLQQTIPLNQTTPHYTKLRRTTLHRITPNYFRAFKTFRVLQISMNAPCRMK